MPGEGELPQTSILIVTGAQRALHSLTKTSDPAFGFVADKYLGYAASKAALNMFTVQLAYELRDTAIKVNSADPGYTATDLNGHRGRQTAAEGAVEDPSPSAATGPCSERRFLR